MKRFTAILLVLIFIAALILGACSDAPQESGAETSAADETAAPETENDSLTDDLPGLDFDGADYTVLCRSEQEYEVYTEEQSGDTVNDAVYSRNRAVEDRFNINIKAHSTPGYWTYREDFMRTLSNAVMAGEGAFDLVVGYEAYLVNAISKNLFMNIYNAEYINTEKDYYFQDAIKELTVYGSLYFLVSDYCLTMWEDLYVMYFNKKLAENFSISDPYQLVRDGAWTIDTLISMTKDLYQDVNGSNSKDKEDLFGFISEYGNVADSYAACFDNPVTRVDEDGNIYLAENNDKTVAILEKMVDFLHNQPGVISMEISSAMISAGEQPLKEIFTSDRALFYQEMLSCAVEWRGMITDFGILPLPKWDEAQEKYQSQCWNGFSVVTIPVDVRDVDMSGAIFEALSCESHNSVIPAYFDIVLTNKAARDTESGEMIEVAREGITFNFGYMHSQAINLTKGPGRVYRDTVNGTTVNFASSWAAIEEKANDLLQALLDVYAANAAQ